jgi:hypothetical protein
MLSILLSVTLLVQSMHLTFRDLVQLDELLEHAQYHKEQFGDNFAIFLSKHYGDQKKEHHQKHHEEREQHEKLPFQHSCTHVLTLIVRLPSFELPSPSESLRDKDSFYYQRSSSELYSKGIFQPPKAA